MASNSNCPYLQCTCEGTQTVNTPSTSFQQQKPKLTVSFSVGGWFQMYHYGVAQALLDAKVMERYDVKLCGASAGSLAVCGLTAELDFHSMRDFALECGDDCRAKPWNLYKMRHYLLRSIRKFGPDPTKDPERLAKVMKNFQERDIEIYATKLPSLEPVKFSNFEDASDVEEALAASCCFVPFVGLPFRLRKTKEWVMDGAMVAFQPRANDPQAITVSPFYFLDSDIRPDDLVPVWWGLRPPAREQHSQLFDMGYNNALAFLVEHELADPSCLDWRKQLAPMSPQSCVTTKRHFWHWAKDAFLNFVLLWILRPIGVGIIYLELLFLSIVSALAVLMPFLPSFVFQSAVGKGKRKKASGDTTAATAESDVQESHFATFAHDGCLLDLYRTLSSLVSPRTFLRLILPTPLSTKVTDKRSENRLGRLSMAYRFFYPFFYYATGEEVNNESVPKAEGESAVSGSPSSADVATPNNTPLHPASSRLSRRKKFNLVSPPGSEEVTGIRSGKVCPRCASSNGDKKSATGERDIPPAARASADTIVSSTVFAPPSMPVEEHASFDGSQGK